MASNPLLALTQLVFEDRCLAERGQPPLRGFRL
jgi:hypothetical protein